MKKTVAACLLVTTIKIFVFGQSPGGVGAPTYWIKADAGTVTAAGPVTNWVSQGSIASTATQATVGAKPTFSDGSGATSFFNYCPYISFDGGDRLAVSSNTFDFGSSSTGMTEFSVFRINSITPANANVFFDWAGSNATIKLKGYDNQCITASGGSTTGSGNQYSIPANTLTKIQHMSGRSSGLLSVLNITNSHSGYNHISASAYSSTISNVNNPYASSGNSALRLSIGSNMNSGEYMNGSLAELIIFNRILSSTEMLEVNSYLGIKYGITLGGNGSTSTSYLNSAGTTIWASGTGYHNDVIGIGRDNGGAGTSGLLQKQSHTSDDSVRLYIGSSLAATNIGNGGSFASDRSFIMMGSGGGKLCATLAANGEIPPPSGTCDIDSRLDMESATFK